MKRYKDELQAYRLDYANGDSKIVYVHGVKEVVRQYDLATQANANTTITCLGYVVNKDNTRREFAL